MLSKVEQKKEFRKERRKNKRVMGKINLIKTQIHYSKGKVEITEKSIVTIERGTKKS